MLQKLAIWEATVSCCSCPLAEHRKTAVTYPCPHFQQGPQPCSSVLYHLPCEAGQYI